MPTLLAHTAQLAALRDCLQRLDPQAAQAIAQHLPALQVAAAALRECNIKLAELATYRAAHGKDLRDINTLRNQIDLLIMPATQGVPPSTQDGS